MVPKTRTVGTGGGIPLVHMASLASSQHGRLRAAKLHSSRCPQSEVLKDQGKPKASSEITVLLSPHPRVDVLGHESQPDLRTTKEVNTGSQLGVGASLETSCQMGFYPQRGDNCPSRNSTNHFLASLKGTGWMRVSLWDVGQWKPQPHHGVLVEPSNSTRPYFLKQ